MPAYGFLKPDDAEDQPNHQLTSLIVWRGFKQHTTAHGIPHVDNATGKVLSVVLNQLSAAERILN